MDNMEKIVIALGGNALQSGNSGATAEAQLEVVKKTCEYIAEISCKGYDIGNLRTLCLLHHLVGVEEWKFGALGYLATKRTLSRCHISR